jgi:AcrR family transcriptional regulator
MPTPARTSLDQIVSAGREILEAEGIDGLTMQHIASAVGVRAPSLYKRIRNRNDLLRLVANDASRELTDRLDAAATTGDARSDLIALATAFRRFARANPAAYGLLFAPLPDDARADPEWSVRGSEAVLDATRRLAGEDDSLEAARTVTAWANGFIAMELAGAFRLGGDVDRAFDYGIDRITRAISSAAAAPPPRSGSAGGSRPASADTNTPGRTRTTGGRRG